MPSTPERCRDLTLSGLRRAAATRQVLLCASAVVTFYVYALVRYLLSPGFSDHAEASTLAVAAAYSHGQPLYHGADTAARYSVMYGPVLYLVPAVFFRLFGYSIFIGKLPFALAGLLAPAVLAHTLYRKHGAWIALVCGSALVPMLLAYRTHVFWVRPEPLVVLCVCIALWATTLRRPLLCALVIGVTAGLAMGCKSYAFLLFAPICGWVPLRHLVRTVLVVGATALGLFFLPFALPGISWAGFAHWMVLVSRHGLDGMQLLRHGAMGALILLPMLGAYLARRRGGLSPQERLRFGTFLLAALAVGLGSGKPGAEPHYFMPFLPTLIFEVAAVLAAPLRWPSETQWLKLLAIEGAICLFMSFWFGVGGLLLDDHEVRRMGAEVERAMRTYHDGALAVGYGGEESDGARLRMLPVFAGHPLLLDDANLMDAQFDGLPVPDATVAAIDACLIKTWLIPRVGEPFALRNFLNRQPLLDARFTGAFARRYQRVEQMVYYDVWRCKTGW